MFLHYFPGTPAWVRLLTDLVLVLHIAGGATGVIAGAAALSFRKGERWHRLAGKTFVAGMLALGSTAIWIGVVLRETGNVFGGVFVCYLIASAWMTVRRGEGRVGRFEIVAMLAVFAVAGVIALGLATGSAAHMPHSIFFATVIMGLVAFAAGAADLSVILRRGLSGAQRIARHLWRMCLGFFMAAAAFVTQPSMFPTPSLWMFLAACLPLLLMVFWLLRVALTNQFKGVGREQPAQAA